MPVGNDTSLAVSHQLGQVSNMILIAAPLSVDDQDRKTQYQERACIYIIYIYLYLYKVKKPYI